MPYGAFLVLQVEAEKALLQLQQQFDSSLSELKSKAEILSTRLDEEVASRKQADTEVSQPIPVHLSLFICNVYKLSLKRSQHEKTSNELHAALKEKQQLEK